MGERPPHFERRKSMPSWTQKGHALTPRWRWQRLLRPLLAIVLLVAATIVTARLNPLPPRFYGTATASDGDSMRLSGDRIRLVGIDAPEHDQVCWDALGEAWPCGLKAQTELARLLRLGTTECQPEGTDKFGRTLARCTVAGADLGAAMVRAGLALATDAYGSEESAARADHIGLWQGRFVDPKTWRDDGPSGDPGKGWLETLWDAVRELTGARTLR